MSIIQGLQNYMVQELSALGSDTFQVQKWPAIRMGHLDENTRNRKRLTLEQAYAINKAPAVKAVGPEDWRYRKTIKYKEKKTNPNVVLGGATPEFQVANNYYVGTGRFLTDADIAYKRHVIVIGKDRHHINKCILSLF